ncbi:PH-interacting protein [Pelomyxa schiedti]|nr:PH-interacting protein [Pelomyxa schiedti]
MQVVPSSNTGKRDLTAGNFDQEGLLFLILHYLHGLGPPPSNTGANEPSRDTLSEVVQLLTSVLEGSGYLPKKHWWDKTHLLSYQEIAKTNSHIPSNYLERIIEKLQETHTTNSSSPHPHKVHSVLAHGRMSLVPLQSSQHPRVVPPPINKFLVYSQIGGINRRRQNTSKQVHSLVAAKYKKLISFCGHRAPIYCLKFDPCGTRIFTGADDFLIKVWNVSTGSLVKSLRGHIDVILDMDINWDGTLLVTVSKDRILRVWDCTPSGQYPCIYCCRSSSPYSSVLWRPPPIIPSSCGVTVMIAACSNRGQSELIQVGTFRLNSFPSPASLSHNCSIALPAMTGAECVHEWQQPGSVTVVTPQSKRSSPTHISFSWDGLYLLIAGSPVSIANLQNGVNVIQTVYEVSQSECQTKRGDSISVCKFAHHAYKFLIGYTSGEMLVYQLDSKTGSFIGKTLSPLPTVSVSQRRSPAASFSKKSKGLRALYAIWNSDDSYVISSMSDKSIIVWSAFTGEILNVLQGHFGDSYVLDHHPLFPEQFISGAYDGKIVLWDLFQKKPLREWSRNVDSVKFEIYDGSFSRDGNFFAVSDKFGMITIYGFSDIDKYKRTPRQQFLAGEHELVEFDENYQPFDRNTHLAVWDSPLGVLVDLDLKPYKIPLLQSYGNSDEAATARLILTIALSPEEILDPSDDEEPWAPSRSTRAVDYSTATVSSTENNNTSQPQEPSPALRPTRLSRRLRGQLPLQAGLDDNDDICVVSSSADEAVEDFHIEGVPNENTSSDGESLGSVSQGSEGGGMVTATRSHYKLRDRHAARNNARHKKKESEGVDTICTPEVEGASTVHTSSTDTTGHNLRPRRKQKRSLDQLAHYSPPLDTTSTQLEPAPTPPLDTPGCATLNNVTTDANTKVLNTAALAPSIQSTSSSTKLRLILPLLPAAPDLPSCTTKTSDPLRAFTPTLSVVEPPTTLPSLSSLLQQIQQPNRFGLSFPTIQKIEPSLGTKLVRPPVLPPTERLPNSQGSGITYPNISDISEYGTSSPAILEPEYSPSPLRASSSEEALKDRTHSPSPERPPISPTCPVVESDSDESSNDSFDDLRPKPKLTRTSGSRDVSTSHSALKIVIRPQPNAGQSSAHTRPLGPPANFTRKAPQSYLLRPRTRRSCFEHAENPDIETDIKPHGEDNPTDTTHQKATTRHWTQLQHKIETKEKAPMITPSKMLYDLNL